MPESPSFRAGHAADTLAPLEVSMPTYLQADRPMTVTTPLGPDILLLVGFSGHETISRLFTFHLELLAENESIIPFDRLLGQKVTVNLERPDDSKRYFNGICCRLKQGMRDQTFTSYQMEIVPEFWFLTRVAQSRIFQQKTVPEILADVLKGLAVDFDLKGTYQPRDYCVQYRETDFNFASRLMEEEGISYFFKHTASGHRMVVVDTPGSFPELSEVAIYDGAIGGNRAEDRVHTWEKDQELKSGKYTLWDHSFELPHKHLEAEKTILESVQAGKVNHKLKLGASDKLEIYDYPGEYAQRFDGISPGGADRPADLQKIFQDNKRTVEIRMQEQAAASLVIQGSSDRSDFVSGSKFTLTRHFDGDGPYLLTSVQHSAKLFSGFRTGGGGGYQYENTFTCIPAALPFRPARSTPRPIVQGTQTAVVVGPADAEIFPDKYSRVKVQFHWDRQGKHDADSSCWIRVGTPWAGKHWGMIHIPRIGQEVVVAFEEGDPDRPIIVGSVYNADMMPPYTLPEHKTQSGIKSRSSLTGTPENFNELRFEDLKDSEEIYFHAEKDFNRVVENNDSLKVGFSKKDDGNQTIAIFNNQNLKVGTPESADGSQSIAVFNNQTLKVGTPESPDGSQTIAVFNNHSLKVGTPLSPDGSQTIEIYKNRTATVKTGDETVKIEQGNRAVTIAMGNDSLTVKMGDQTTKISLGSSTTEALQSIELKVGQSSIKLDQMGVTIQGMTISINGQIQTKVTGLMTQINGDAMLMAKGAITMIN